MKEFLMFALPSGFLSSLFTWYTTRRKQNNDVLSELQKSINLLADENKKILEENVQLRKENAELKARLEETLVEVKTLNKRIERFQKLITKNEDKIKNSADSSNVIGNGDSVTVMSKLQDNDTKQATKKRHTTKSRTVAKTRKTRGKSNVQSDESNRGVEREDTTSDSGADVEDGAVGELTR